MGCGKSVPRTDSPTSNSGDMAKPAKANSSTTAIKSALLIQQWYRRYRARLEARQRCTWTVFQSLEYAGEADQLRLYNFFNSMLAQVSKDPNGQPIISMFAQNNRMNTDISDEDEDLLELTNPNKMTVGSSYKGPHLKFPLTMKQLECLIAAFKKKQRLHAKYTLELLHETRKALQRMPNIRQASTAVTKQITICGDLHGKLDDLLVVWYKNGLPSLENPYIFNGDFVDRGPNSVEISILLFGFMLLHQSCLFINRGNHEDHVMNLRYGFIKEVMTKYKSNATKVVRLFEDVFSWLPLATVIDQKVLVTHGGISDKTDLEFLAQIDRHKYLSALRPPVIESPEVEDGETGERDTTKESPKHNTAEKVNLKEWRQILDVLWSDPKPQYGCRPNTFRGGGCYWGPDITDLILEKHNFTLLIRSHECKPEGYEWAHNRKVLTLFSASNYYEIGSNKGAYAKMGPDHVPRIMQYMVTKGQSGRKFTIKQRVHVVEEAAIQHLRKKIYANMSSLVPAFQKYDPDSTGLIKVNDWCSAMSNVMQMDLPWRSLRVQLVQCSEDGLVDYQSTFHEIKIENKYENNDSSTTEALFRHKDSLETMFRAIDKDNSGVISMEEFEEACLLLGQHTDSPLPRESIQQMAKCIDVNRDGFIDFSEFLEAFRIVDKLEQTIIRRQSETSVSTEGQDD